MKRCKYYLRFNACSGNNNDDIDDGNVKVMIIMMMIEYSVKMNMDIICEKIIAYQNQI